MCPEVRHKVGFSSKLFLAHLTLVHYGLVPAGLERFFMKTDNNNMILIIIYEFIFISVLVYFLHTLSPK